MARNYEGGTDEHGFYVPFGRRVYIKQGTEDVLKGYPNCFLIFEDDFKLSVDSDYKDILETKGSSLLTLASGSFELFGGAVPSGQFALQGMQIWEKTEPISFNIDVSINSINSGLEDIIKPVRDLMSLTAPDKSEVGLLGQTLIPPGPNLASILALAGLSDNAAAKKLNDAITIKAGKGVFNILVGKYAVINNVVITKVEPVFSSVIDVEGYPTSCKLSIEFKTVEVATSNMLNSIFNHTNSV